MVFYISCNVFQPGSHSDRLFSALAFSQNLTESSQAALISANTRSPSFLRLTTTKCRHPKVSCIAVHLEPIRCGNFCFLLIQPIEAFNSAERSLKAAHNSLKRSFWSSCQLSQLVDIIVIIIVIVIAIARIIT